VSYSILNLRPYFLRSYSSPPKIAASPENQFLKVNVPPCPEESFLKRKFSFNSYKGLVIFESLPRTPQPIPKVKSKLFIAFEATKYSEEKSPVPAKSLMPTATLGI
tara:strand:+ start:3913 stop:4230 length:318 start_codon:yes stop_codon:yes gene_type:complete